MTEGWIPRDEYDAIQAKMPILCVDLLPLQASTGAVGLIRRVTHDEQEGWCLVGGAVMRNETLHEAVARHVESSLGKAFECRLLSEQPLLVIEYFPDPEVGDFHDPRKHAVALSFAGSCEGDPQPMGEALEFRWFERNRLDDVEFGFGQSAVVSQLLRRLETISS